VLRCLADPDVQNHLVQPRHLHRVGVLELFHELRRDFLLIALAQPRLLGCFDYHLRLLHLLAALLADAHLGAVCQEAMPNPGRPATLRAHQREVGDVNRRLLLHDPRLGHPLARPHVPLHDVHALHARPVLGGQDFQNLAALATITAGEHLHRVFSLELESCHGSYNPSPGLPVPTRQAHGLEHFRRQGDDLHVVLLAQLRATGPKMRVPFGLFLSPRITAALSSKRIVEPSGRLYSLAVRTTTAFTTSPFFTEPPGVAAFTEATITSPTPAVRRFPPASTRMHIRLFAPVLSATVRRVVGRIMAAPRLPSAGSGGAGFGRAPSASPCSAAVIRRSRPGRPRAPRCARRAPCSAWCAGSSCRTDGGYAATRPRPLPSYSSCRLPPCRSSSGAACARSAAHRLPWACSSARCSSSSRWRVFTRAI